VLQALDDAAVGQWYRAVVEVLSESSGRLNDLNVFPVPDGDTGTNLLLTAQAAVAALDMANGIALSALSALIDDAAQPEQQR